jgi:hypothetical protein
MDVSKPTEILDKMIDLARWWETPIGGRYGKVFVEIMAQREHYPALYSQPERFGAFQAFCLQRSLPYFVTDQMVDKIWEFSKGFDTLGFYPEEVPSDYGFMWLAKPVHILDAQGKIQVQRAITWVKQDDGVALIFYADKHDSLDEINVAMRADPRQDFALLPELTINHIQPVPWGDGTKFFQHEAAEAEEYVRNHRSPGGAAYNVETILLAHREQFAFTRFLLACWEWMGYQLPSRALPHRQMARRLGRSRLDARDVLVIDLQPRAKSPLGPATHQVVEWHYRFRVRAHKRHWVDKHGNHRVTDVHSYIKGDPNLPMVERDILFNVRRGHAPI